MSEAGRGHCPFPGCFTEIPLDGRAGCYFHLNAPRVPMTIPMTRHCSCGGTIDPGTNIGLAVARHNQTSEHCRWGLGLMPPFSSRRHATIGLCRG